MKPHQTETLFLCACAATVATSAVASLFSPIAHHFLVLLLVLSAMIVIVACLADSDDL